MKASSVYESKSVINILHIGVLKVRLYSIGMDADPNPRTSGIAVRSWSIALQTGRYLFPKGCINPVSAKIMCLRDWSI
ncbi:MAG: hypothetical protein L6282_03715 [Candidatus Methanoperedenaceae archaeon]|nr:hypothetical protein [Candidatus Methanoperedenaceae archaeon]